MDNLSISGYNLWLHEIQLYHVVLWINLYELATLGF